MITARTRSCSDFLLSAVNNSIKPGGLSVAAPQASALVTGRHRISALTPVSPYLLLPCSRPELPELPLYAHATFKDPGGVASTRQSALETAAFRDTQTHQLSYPSVLINHNSTIFQGSIYSLCTHYTLAPHVALL